MRSSRVVLCNGVPAGRCAGVSQPGPRRRRPRPPRRCQRRARRPAAPKEETESQRAFKSIPWTKGPAKVGIANHAEIQVPEGYAYTGASGAQRAARAHAQPERSGTELGILTDDKPLEMFLALRVRRYRLR